MSTIYLVRHGQTEFNVARLYQGQRVDGLLTDLGRSQATAIGQFLKSKNLQFVFVSPQQRALTSVGIILDQVNSKPGQNSSQKTLEYSVIDSFKEMDHGALEGKNVEAVRELLPELDPRSVAAPYKYFSPYPQGESFKDVFVRVSGAAEVVKNLNSNLAIVSHRLVTPMIMCAILDLDPTNHLERFLDNDEIIQIDTDSKEWKIIKF